MRSSILGDENTTTLEPPFGIAAYAQFCRTADRCVPTAPTALGGIGYARFCYNSLSLCAGAKTSLAGPAGKVRPVEADTVCLHDRAR